MGMSSVLYGPQNHQTPLLQSSVVKSIYVRGGFHDL